MAMCLLVLSGVGATILAQEWDTEGPMVKPVEPLAPISLTANKGAIALKSLTGDYVSTDSAAWTTFTSTSISIPRGQTGRILATFAGQELCQREDKPGGWCAIRILVDGVEMFPQAGTNFAFASVGGDSGNNFDHESKSMDRISGELSPGPHAVVVQGAVVLGASAFDVFDWQLTLVVWRVS